MLSMVPPIPQPVSAAIILTTLRFQPGGSASSTATGRLHLLVSLCASFSRLGYSPLHTSHVLMAPKPTRMPRPALLLEQRIILHHIVSSVTTSKRGKQLRATPCLSSARVTVAHTARVPFSIFSTRLSEGLWMVCPMPRRMFTRRWLPVLF